MYKTIVVHIDGRAEQDSRLRAAAWLANEHGAHLVGSAATGVPWLDYALLAGSIGAPIPDPHADFEGLRVAAECRLEVFRREAARLGVASFQAQRVDDHARYALLLQWRYADLVVLSRDLAVPDEPTLSGRVRHLPEHIALDGARPVLVVPPAYDDACIADVAVAGWDGSMQALRAIAGALPLLQRATDVKLALINPDELSELHGEQPGADMALYLARHGIRVDVVLERTGSTVADALVALARDCGAGLMVAGAYGHSRYRERVLGGATRELLERVHVPLLIAH